MSELIQLSNSFAIPGCRLYQSGMTISGELTREELDGVSKTLNAIEQCGLWWWGDYLCHLSQWDSDAYAEGVAKSSYSYQSLRIAKWLCSKIGLFMRINTLTFNHHQEALSECGGNVDEAISWLKLADAGDAEGKRWTVSELRKAIRDSKKGHTPEEHERAQPSSYDHFKEFRRALKLELNEATPDYLDEMEGQILETLNMVREARALV